MLARGAGWNKPRVCVGQKKSPAKVRDFAGPRGKKKYTRLTQLALLKLVYRRPPPPPRELPPPRDPPLDAPRPELEELGVEPEDDPEDPLRLCTTDGLIRTAWDPFPLDTLPLVPAVGRLPEVAPDVTPLLLPWNCCHPPALDCDVDPAVDPDVDEPRLIADVLPDEVEEGEGLTRCHPPLLEDAPEAALRVAGPVAPALERVAGLFMLLADRAIACLC
jgi:hypothetical protein